jgi:medium-chain acyl-[acyl-carrier-protein] hydrolase
MDEQLVWKEKLYVKSYEVDCTGGLKLQSLFNYFQEAAGNQASHLGTGYEELQKKGLFWVLSRIKIHITKMPRWHEVVSLVTWPKGVDRLFALRDFRMTDDQLNTLLTATSAWLLLDTERNRPQKMSVLPFRILLNAGEHAINESLEKLKPARDLTLRYERKILLSNLDVNNHVNNAEYMKWIVDCFDPDQIGTKSIGSIQVNYLDEALLGDTIALYSGRETEEGDTYYLEGVSRNKESKIFQARVEWK